MRNETMDFAQESAWGGQESEMVCRADNEDEVICKDEDKFTAN